MNCQSAGRMESYRGTDRAELFRLVTRCLEQRLQFAVTHERGGWVLSAPGPLATREVAA